MIICSNLWSCSFYCVLAGHVFIRLVMWFKKNRPVEVAEILVKVDAINFMKSLQILKQFAFTFATCQTYFK